MKLEWDKTTERLYEMGVRNTVLFPASKTGVYGTGVAWNGITAINESPSGGESNPIWADDGKYVDLRSPEERGLTIEAYMYPFEFEQCDGAASIAPGVTIRNQPRLPFGLCWRTAIGNDTELDEYGYKLHFAYGCKAAPSDRNSETINDNPDAITFSWECTTDPVKIAGYRPTPTLEIDSTKVDATKLAALEAIVYGSANTDPRLPMPEEIVNLFAA